MDIVSFGAAGVVALFFFFYAVEWRKKKQSRSSLPAGPWPWPVLGNLPFLVRNAAAPHRALALAAREHGPLFTIHMGAHPVLVVSSPSMARQFLQGHDRTFANRPPFRMVDLLLYGHRNSVIFSPLSPPWRELRKLFVSELFSPRKMREHESERLEEVACLVNAIGSWCRKGLDKEPGYSEEEGQGRSQESDRHACGLLEGNRDCSKEGGQVQDCEGFQEPKHHRACVWQEGRHGGGSKKQGPHQGKSLEGRGAWQGFELRESLVAVSANVVGRLALSTRVMDWDTSFKSELHDILRESSGMALNTLIGDFIPVLRWLDIFTEFRMRRSHARIDKFFTNVVMERLQELQEEEEEPQMAKKRGKPDFLDVLLAATSANRGSEMLDPVKSALLVDILI